MLSILVCSVNPVLLEQFRKNVDKTIGVAYELLIFDNRKEKKGLCAVYNSLAEKAAYNILCFVHEDVLFTTQDWGATLYKTFHDNNQIGAVGVAGSKYKSALFSGWFTGQKAFDCANILHRTGGIEERMYLNPHTDSKIEEVVCLDGVFICCRKDIWATTRFDDVNLTGFHLYDLDFTLRVARAMKIIVDYRIEIIHITAGGDFSDNWMETSMAYHLRHQNALPFHKEVNRQPHIEMAIAKATLDVLKNYSISWKNKRDWIQLQRLYQYPEMYYSIIKFLLYKPLGLRYIHKLFRLK